MVGGNIISPINKKTGISFQEKFYLSKEVSIKYYEGIIWGAMMGSFGGCYSIRKDMICDIPVDKLYMDDFYITLKVLENKGKAISEINAIAYEDVSNIIAEEFRRKIRISLGTIPILLQYFKVWLFPRTGIGFCLLSHKVIRYLGPILLIISFLSNLFIININIFFKISFILQFYFIFINPIIDILLKKLNCNIKLLRFITHFYFMNWALLLGMIKYFNSNNINSWKPTERNQ
jgi:hypothetical protein